ncbi:MAG: response regulator transcription factor [Arachnia sp.]
MTTEPAPHGRVLIVEDEPILAGTVRNYLDRSGFETRCEADGLKAVEAAREWTPDLVILDLGLPSIDGVEVCRRLRTFSDCYIIMLTARADEVDTLVGLSVGADDYITKPFSPRELVARVQACLRRPRVTDGPERVPEEAKRIFGILVVDPAARQVVLDGTPVDVTPTEFDVLDVLSAQPRVAFSRRQLIDVIWGLHWSGDEHMVDVHVANVRRKLGDNPTNPRFIATVRGHGYRMGSGH